MPNDSNITALLRISHMLGSMWEEGLGVVKMHILWTGRGLIVGVKVGMCIKELWQGLVTKNNPNMHGEGLCIKC